MSKIDEVEYKNYSINIYVDEDPIDPRGWDNLGIMEINSHRDYNLPSEGGGLTLEYYEEDKENPAKTEDGRLLSDLDGLELAGAILRRDKNIVALFPVQGYDHGGLSISIGNTPDQWDGGRLGFIYTTAEKCKEIGLDPVKNIEIIKNNLKTEIEIYDQYLTGEVYGYMIEDEDGEESGGCWGYYGSDHEENGLLESARGEIDAEIKDRKEKAEAEKKSRATDKTRLLNEITAALNSITARLNEFKADPALKAAINRNIKSIKSIIDKNL
jgi:hypothetical protein